MQHRKRIVGLLVGLIISVAAAPFLPPAKADGKRACSGSTAPLVAHNAAEAVGQQLPIGPTRQQELSSAC